MPGLLDVAQLQGDLQAAAAHAEGHAVHVDPGVGDGGEGGGAVGMCCGGLARVPVVPVPHPGNVAVVLGVVVLGEGGGDLERGEGGGGGGGPGRGLGGRRGVLGVRGEGGFRGGDLCPNVLVSRVEVNVAYGVDLCAGFEE